MSDTMYLKISSALETMLARRAGEPSYKLTVATLSRESGVSRTTLYKPEYSSLLARLTDTPSEDTSLTSGKVELLRSAERVAELEREAKDLRNEALVLKNRIYALEFALLASQNKPDQFVGKLG